MGRGIYIFISVNCDQLEFVSFLFVEAPGVGSFPCNSNSAIALVPPAFRFAKYPQYFLGMLICCCQRFAKMTRAHIGD